MRLLLLQSEVVAPPVETALSEPAWAIWLAWGAVPLSAGLLGLLAGTGVLSLRRLEASPKRAVGLTLLDALAGVWLWFVGSLAVGVLLQGQAGDVGASGLSLSPDRILLMQACAFGPGIAYWVWRMSHMPGYASAVGLRSTWVRRDVCWIVLGLPAIVVLFLATQQIAAVVSRLLGSPPPAVQHTLLETYASLRDDGEYATMLGLLLSTVVAAPVLEELFHRGFLQTALVNALGPGRRWLAILAVSGFFAVLHLGSVPWVALPALMLLGVCFGFLYERTGSLWPPILVHAGFNAINVAYVLAVV